MTQRQFILGALSALIVVSVSAPNSAGGQVVRRDTTPRAAQKPVVRNASVDSLVECTPVVAPVKKKPVVRRRTTAARAAVPKKAVATVKPKKVATGARRPIVRRARRVTPKPASGTVAHTTTIVMCRPVRPLAPLASGTPTEQSVVPVPRLAPAAAPAPAPVAEEGPPLFVSTAPGMPVVTAGGGRSWLPFAVIPALFIPFIHSGGRHRGSTPPVDTTSPPDSIPVKPPVDTVPVTPPVDTVPVTPPVDTVPVTPPIDTIPIPPVIPPPTTVPEPGTIAMLGSGLLGLAGVSVRRRRKKR